jgi:predicted regulator of Ras-like GTPase activity (Roadblock/LC7/MglB family)
MMVQADRAELESVEATFEGIFADAMRKQPQIQHIVVSSEQGLVIAYKARTKGAEQQLAALSPVLGDAGEALFNALSLTPLGEIMLIGSEGTAYFARMKSAPAFLLVGAKGQVNVGLLRIIAADIEAGAGSVITRILR